MRFEWDENKNIINTRKHKIDFRDVPSVFDAPLLVEYDDRQNYSEDRWTGIGLLRGIVVVVVVFTERDVDTIRIISARKANRYERKQYEEFIKN